MERMERVRVLVVDDEGELVHTVVERLGLRGFAAQAVTSGTAALDLLAKEEFDVVVLDVKMPGLGGLETLSRIKLIREDLPVILVTGHGSAEMAEEGLETGAYRYIMKPVNIDTLVATVWNALGM